MSGKTILELSSPVTQSREAVAQLIAYFNHDRAPAEMPAFFRLTGEMVLVQSNKKDAYYVVTPKSCSCPSATYHPGKPCKHQRGYFPQPKNRADRDAEVEAEMTKQKGAKRLARSPGDSIKPVGKWPGGFNGPVNMPGKDLLEGYETSFEAEW